MLAPGKILAVGLNYAAHAAEQNIEPPSAPLIFSKNVTALIAPNDFKDLVTFLLSRRPGGAHTPATTAAASK